MIERIEYTVNRIDGDYAYLSNINDSSVGDKCVARATSACRNRRRKQTCL